MKFLLPALLLICPLVKAEPEKIFVITADKISHVQTYLDNGWTVKHQSITASGSSRVYAEECLVVITLSPPTPEALTAIAKKKSEEADKKKQEFAKKRESFLKEQEEKNKVEIPDKKPNENQQK